MQRSWPTQLLVFESADTFFGSQHVANILKGISKQLNSDPAAVSLAQLLRIPGSRNPKNNTAYKEIFDESKVRYDIDEFSQFQQESNCSSSPSLASQQVSPVLVATSPIEAHLEQRCII